MFPFCDDQLFGRTVNNMYLCFKLFYLKVRDGDLASIVSLPKQPGLADAVSYGLCSDLPTLKCNANVPSGISHTVANDKASKVCLKVHCI